MASFTHEDYVDIPMLVSLAEYICEPKERIKFREEEVMLGELVYMLRMTRTE